MINRILVLIKQVPATENVKMDEETGTLVRTNVEAVINPLDLYAVEEAIRIKEQDGGTPWVGVVSMGPPAAAEAIREAIAMGCDEGVLISGREFSGADTWATAYALSQAVSHLGEFDLVLCGERATDGETGQVGPMVGTMLDLPVLTYVSRIESSEAGTVVAHRVIEGGHEVVRSVLPALLSVVKEINEPRLPNLSGKRAARHAEIPVLTPEEIGADISCIGLSGSPTRVVKVSHPTLTRVGKVVSTETASPEECIEQLMQALQSAEIR